MPQTKTRPSDAAAELKDVRLFHEACYVGSEWMQAASGRTFDVDNPATREIIGRVPSLSAAETRRAIEAANAAFPVWSKKTAKERAGILRRWFGLVMENQEDLARPMTVEQASAGIPW